MNSFASCFQIETLISNRQEIDANYLAICYPKNWIGHEHPGGLGYCLGYGDTRQEAHTMALGTLDQVRNYYITPWNGAVNVSCYIWVWHMINKDPIAEPEFPPEVIQAHWLEEKMIEEGQREQIIEFTKQLTANLRIAIALKAFDLRPTSPELMLCSGSTGCWPAGIAAASDPSGTLIQPWYRVIWISQNLVAGQVTGDDYREYWRQ